MYIFALALIFLIRIRFPPHKSLHSIILERYDLEGLKSIRSLEKVDLKYNKAELNLLFVTRCRDNGLTPKFLEFKLYSSNIRNNAGYRKYQRQLLSQEIGNKRSDLRRLELERQVALDDVKGALTWLDFKHVWSVIRNTNNHKVDTIKRTHERKLFNLGLRFQFDPLDPNKLILNLSNRILTSTQKEALSLGPKFAFFPTQINYNNFFMAVEKLYNQITECDMYQRTQDSVNIFRSNMKSLAFKTYYSFKPRPCPYQKELVLALKELKKDNSIIITKPDKGNGTVIVDKSDYIDKMNNILDDPINFKKIEENLYTMLVKYEDRNNRLVDSLFKSGAINAIQRKNMKSTGPRPGIMFDQPKVHKRGVPMRPILSTIGTHNYQMSKFMVSVLNQLCSNEYVVSHGHHPNTAGKGTVVLPFRITLNFFYFPNYPEIFGKSALHKCCQGQFEGSNRATQAHTFFPGYIISQSVLIFSFGHQL